MIDVGDLVGHFLGMRVGDFGLVRLIVVDSYCSYVVVCWDNYHVLYTVVSCGWLSDCDIVCVGNWEC